MGRLDTALIDYVEAELQEIKLDVKHFSNGMNKS